MTNKIETCDVCEAELIESDGYLSCQVYMEGTDKIADEHTSIESRRGK